jgi:AmmeMemoRadiSam system protein A
MQNGDEDMQGQTDTRQPLTTQQGMALVALARQTLAHHFNPSSTSPAAQDLERQLADPAFQARCGTFVTLKINNQLRGCIGSLTADASIVAGVRDNALNAAFRDPRFSPLTHAELDGVHIEVSVLSAPVELDYGDADDLLAKLKPGIDGVILKKGLASATFLPQVWDQLPRPEAFLSNLCMKAGLTPDRWRRGDLAIQIYRVQYFEEPV